MRLKNIHLIVLVFLLLVSMTTAQYYFYDDFQNFSFSSHTQCSDAPSGFNFNSLISNYSETSVNVLADCSGTNDCCSYTNRVTGGIRNSGDTTGTLDSWDYMFLRYNLSGIYSGEQLLFTLNYSCSAYCPDDYRWLRLEYVDKSGTPVYNDVLLDPVSENFNITLTNLAQDSIFNITDLWFLSVYTKKPTGVGNPAFTMNVWNFEINETPNSYPDINITYDDEICFNSSNGKAYFNYTISMYDSEADSLYIANKLTSFRDLFRSFTFSKEKCSFYFFGLGVSCIQIPDYTGLAIGSFYRDSNTCRISQDSSNLSMLNVLQNGDVYMFNLQDGCTGDKEWLYHLENTFNDLTLNLNIYDFSIGDTFNISFTDTFLNELGKAKIERESSGNLLIYDLNSTPFLVYNQSYTGNILDITFTEDPENNYIEIKNADSNVILGNVTYNLGEYDTAVFIMAFEGNFWIKDFYYHGTFLTPQFNSFTSPTTYFFTANYSGTYEFKIFYTDGFHLGSSYREETFSLTALTGQECALRTGELRDTDTGRALSPLRNALMGICTSLDNAFTLSRSDGSTYDPSRYGFCFIMYIAFFIITAIISAGLSIWIYFIKPSLVFSFFGLTWQIFNIMGYFILDYSATLIIVIALAFTISLVMLLRQIFLTGDTPAGA